MINKYIFLLAFVLFLSSCSKFHEDLGVPSFVHIDKIVLDAGIGQGTDSAYISDAWVYINGEFHGAFELPATFPLLRTGQTTLTIRPGVIINGISGTRSINPFFESIELTTNLVADSISRFSLQTKYVSNAKFPWNSVGQEDFEQGGVSLDSINSSKVGLIKSKLDVYEGDFSGLIHLDTAHDYFLGASVNDFLMPSDKSGMLLELNCKNTSSEFLIGVYFNFSGGTVSRVDYLYLNPTTEWKKIYVNLTSLLSSYSTANSFKIFMEARLPANKNEVDVFIDNVKLVHY